MTPQDVTAQVLREAIGLMTTAKPNMVMRGDDPVGMAHEVVAEVTSLRAERDALAAALEGRKACVKCEGRGYVEGPRSMGYETDTDDERMDAQIMARRKCECRKVDLTAILAAHDASTRRKALEEAADRMDTDEAANADYCADQLRDWAKEADNGA